MSKKALELKPCPLCGGKAEVWRAHPENPKRPAWVACMDRCVVLVTREFDTTEEAIKKWNTRPFEVPQITADDLESARAALSKATGGE